MKSILQCSVKDQKIRQRSAGDSLVRKYFQRVDARVSIFDLKLSFMEGLWCLKYFIECCICIFSFTLCHNPANNWNPIYRWEWVLNLRYTCLQKLPKIVELNLMGLGKKTHGVLFWQSKLSARCTKARSLWNFKCYSAYFCREESKYRLQQQWASSVPCSPAPVFDCPNIQNLWVSEIRR